MFVTDQQNTNKTENTSTDLAEVIREETDDGRLLVRVLSDIAQGNIEDTKPHHRIAAVKELYRQRRDHTPDYSCGCDNKNGARAAANTTGEEIKKPSDDSADPDQPSAIAHAAESEMNQPTEVTDPVDPEPDQPHDDPSPTAIDPDPTAGNTDLTDPGPDQPSEKAVTTDLNPGPALENPDPANLPPRRSRLSRRERRRQNRNSNSRPGASGKGPGKPQLASHSIISSGFR